MEGTWHVGETGEARLWLWNAQWGKRVGTAEAGEVGLVGQGRKLGFYS